MSSLGWAILSAIGWFAAGWYWYMARRWQRLALWESELVQHYAEKLTESIKLTDAVLGANAELTELAAREVLPSATHQRPN
jgi:hypothetical protein